MGGTYLQKLYIVGLFRVLYAQPAFALADEQKAARIAFVNEFIRELSAHSRYANRS
jgi:hypothetical protein